METSLERCIKTAKDAGCPRDQTEKFIKSGYIPLPWQWLFHAAAREADNAKGPVDVGLGGARGPGKSHAILAQAALDDCQRVEGLKGLFLRQTGLAAKESFDDLIEKVVRGHTEYEKTGHLLKFPKTRSRILLGGFKNEKDIDKYIGIEYDFIIVEELNQLTEEKYTKLRGSLRTSKTNWRPRMYTSFNPGGIGHGAVKERYITPYREGLETDTRFIAATYLLNPYLNPEYISYLEGLSGDLGKAWREGEWDIFAGQYFSEWRYSVHVVQPFEIPSHWVKFICGDYGYSKPSAVYWCAVDEAGKIYAYRELYKTQLTFETLTAEIVAMTPVKEKIKYWVFDPAIWAKSNEKEGEPAKISGFEIMGRKYKDIIKTSLNMIRANNDRINGWNTLREYLKAFIRDSKESANFQCFTTCTELIRTLPTLIYDEHQVEDLDSDGEDHAADAVRYGIMSRPPKAPSTVQGISRLLGTQRRDDNQTNYE